MFNYIFVMTRGGPIHSTYVLEFYIYRMGIRYRQIGLASTASVVLLGIALIFVVLQYVARKKILKERE
jgi:multiple sugar transport system permease protein